MKIAWIAEAATIKYRKLLSRIASSAIPYGGIPVKVKVGDDYSDCDIVISFGNTEKKILPHQTWLHVDGAYFGRPDYIRITKNAYHPSTQLLDIAYPSDRWDALGVDIKPWIPDNQGSILICKVSDRNAKFNCLDQEKMINDILPILRSQTDREIVIREKDEKFKTPFTTVLDNTWRVITWASIVGLDAIVNGIPVCSLTPSVCTLASTDINNICKPNLIDRTQLLYNIAYYQWTRDEVISGQVWRHYMVEE